MAFTPWSLLDVIQSALGQETCILDRAAETAVGQLEPLLDLLSIFADGEALFNVGRCLDQRTSRQQT
jgi:hypothetical protein